MISHNFRTSATVDEVLQWIHDCSDVHMYACACTYTGFVCAEMGAKTHANIQKLTYMPNILTSKHIRA